LKLCLEFGFKQTFVRKMSTYNVDEIDTKAMKVANATGYKCSALFEKINKVYASIAAN